MGGWNFMVFLVERSMVEGGGEHVRFFLNAGLGSCDSP